MVPLLESDGSALPVLVASSLEWRERGEGSEVAARSRVIDNKGGKKARGAMVITQLRVRVRASPPSRA